MTSLLQWAGYSAIFMEWNDDATSTFLGTLWMAPPPWMGWACNLHFLKWNGHPIWLSYGTCLHERKFDIELNTFQSTSRKYSEPSAMRMTASFFQYSVANHCIVTCVATRQHRVLYYIYIYIYIYLYVYVYIYIERERDSKCIDLTYTCTYLYMKYVYMHIYILEYPVLGRGKTGNYSMVSY